MMSIVYQLFFGVLMCVIVDCCQEEENSMTIVIPKNNPTVLSYNSHNRRFFAAAVNCDVCFITSVKPSKYLNISLHTNIRGCNTLVTKKLAGCPQVASTSTLYVWNKDIPVYDVHFPNGMGYKIGRETNVKFIELSIQLPNKLNISDDFFKNLWVKVYWTKDKLTPVLSMWMNSRHVEIPPGNITSVDVICDDTYYTIDIVAYRAVTYKYVQKVTAYIVDDCDHICNWTVVDSIDPGIPKSDKFFTVDPPLLVRGIQMLAVRGIFNNTGNEIMRYGDYDDSVSLWVYLFKDLGDKYKNFEVKCEKQGPPDYTFLKDILLNNVPPI